jgi:hypothetical protein
MSALASAWSAIAMTLEMNTNPSARDVVGALPDFSLKVSGLIPTSLLQLDGANNVQSFDSS